MKAYRVTNWIYGHVSSFSYHMGMLDSIMTRHRGLDDQMTRDQYLLNLRTPKVSDDIETEIGLDDVETGDVETGDVETGHVETGHVETGAVSPDAAMTGKVHRMSTTGNALIFPVDDGAY